MSGSGTARDLGSVLCGDGERLLRRRGEREDALRSSGDVGEVALGGVPSGVPGDPASGSSFLGPVGKRSVWTGPSFSLPGTGGPVLGRKEGTESGGGDGECVMP